MSAPRRSASRSRASGILRPFAPPSPRSPPRPCPPPDPPRRAARRAEHSRRPSAGSPSSSSASSPGSAPSRRSRRSAPTTRSPPDLAGPADADRLRLPEETVIYDRTGQDRAGPVRRRQARGRHLRPDPAGPARRDDGGRGQDVLGERGLRPGGDRLGRPRARCAATPAAPRPSPSSSSGRGCSTRRSSRTRTGPPSASSRRSSSRSGVTQAFPGETGKQHDHHGLPQPELLRQPELRREGRGRSPTSGSTCPEIDAGPGRDHRRAAQVAVELRPRPQRHRAVRLGRRRGRRLPEGRQLVVPATRPIVQRRNQILDLLAAGRTPMSGDRVHAGRSSRPPRRRSGRPGAARRPRAGSRRTSCGRSATSSPTKLCGPDADDLRRQLERGGLRVTTTLDASLQKIAEKWVQAAAIVPHAKDPTAAAKALGFKKLEPWMAQPARARTCATARSSRSTTRPASSSPTSAARTTTRPSTKPEFQPQYDVVGKGYRQPGSAFKPFNYAIGIDDHDDHRRHDADGRRRPTSAAATRRATPTTSSAARSASATPSSSRSTSRPSRRWRSTAPDHVFAKAQDFGMVFQGDDATADLALALGVQEVRPVDLVTAYGTLANGGKAIGHTTILTDPGHERQGRRRARTCRRPASQVVEPAGRLHRDRHPGRQHEPQASTRSGASSPISGPDGRRPATLKTGTNNDAKDLNAYGYIAPPTADGRAAGAYALAVGAWNGNSRQQPGLDRPRARCSRSTSRPTSGRASSRRPARKWPVTRLRAPATAWSGSRSTRGPGSARRPAPTSVDEWFIAGTEPKDAPAAGTCGDRRRRAASASRPASTAG